MLPYISSLEILTNVPSPFLFSDVQTAIKASLKPFSLFLLKNNFTPLLQLLPVLVLIVISVFTQLMATNPPYSLFYKP